MPLQYVLLVDELSALRRGVGLTVQAIARSPSVLAALGNPPAEVGLQRLVDHVRALGEDEPSIVLRRAYAIDVDPPGKVSHRREQYHEQTGRAVKTIIGYEDAKIRELAAVLVQGKQSTRLFVLGWVRDRVMTTGRIEFEQEVTPLPPNVQWTSHYEGTNEALPLLLYTPPSHYTPDAIVLGVVFDGELPTEVWGILTTDLFEVSALRFERQVLHEEGEHDYYISYPHPQQGHYYGIGWTFEDRPSVVRPPALEKFHATRPKSYNATRRRPK
jgi:hypothetical protein